MLSDKHRRQAWEAVDYARTTRAVLRRNSTKGDKQRDRAIDNALLALRRSMRPLRTEIAKTQYEPPTPYREGLRTLSGELQREKRKLWKMRQPSQRMDRTVVHRLRDMIERE